MSVVTKETSKVKLSLLQPKTTSDFGEPLEAAKYFVPPDGKLLAFSQRKVEHPHACGGGAAAPAELSSRASWPC